MLANGPRHFKWRNDPFIPVEFSVAAYRFGHSQVRPSYRANFATSAGDPGQQFFALFLDPAATDPDDLADLGLDRRTPLWFYVLREAEVTAAGEYLGPVGGRIVAEVIVGLIHATASPTCARTRTGPRPTARPAASGWSTCSSRPGWWPRSAERGALHLSLRSNPGPR